MKSIIKSTLLCGMGAALAATSAMGAFTFTNGDLILGFQATGGTGSTKNVFFNLGAGTYHRDNPGNLGNPVAGNNPFGTTGQTSIGNVGATLTLVYGANWYTRDDIYFGVIGNRNPQLAGGIGAPGPINGDPTSTLYLSTPAATVAGGLLYTADQYAPASLSSGATKFTGMEAIMPLLTVQLDNAGILDKDTQPTQWNNGWTTWNPTPGAAFTVFTGGIQQNFGKATDATYVDLQRVLATTTGANPTGLRGGGTYETTFAIGSDGSISSIPEPSAALLGGLGVLALLRRRRA